MTGGNHAAHHIFVITAIDQSHNENRPTTLNNARREPMRRRSLRAPDTWFGFKRHRWLGAVPETPFGRNLETVRDFCNISVDALLSVRIGVRFCSVYYTDSVTRINQNCLKKKIKKKSNKVLFQLRLVSVTVIDGSAIHYAKTRLLTWNFRIQFYDLQRGPPSYLRHSSLFWFNLGVIETRARDLG